MHMVHLCSRCSQTVHAMDMEIMPLDRAKINVANVVPVLGDNPVVLGAMCLNSLVPSLQIAFNCRSQL